MFEENISTEFGMKNVDETTNDVIEEINQNELMSKKNKKFMEFWIIWSTYLY